MKKLLFCKTSHQHLERHWMERYKMSLSHISDKGLMSRLYKSFLQIHIHTTEIICRESHLFKEKEQIIYLNLKYISSKLQSNNTSHLWMATIKNAPTQKTKQARFSNSICSKIRQNWTSWVLLVRSQNCVVTTEENEVLLEVIIRNMMTWSGNFMSWWIYTKLSFKKAVSQRDIHKHIAIVALFAVALHRSFITEKHE